MVWDDASTITLSAPAAESTRISAAVDLSFIFGLTPVGRPGLAAAHGAALAGAQATPEGLGPSSGATSAARYEREIESGGARENEERVGCPRHASTVVGMARRCSVPRLLQDPAQVLLLGVHAPVWELRLRLLPHLPLDLVEHLLLGVARGRGQVALSGRCAQRRLPAPSSSGS